MSRDPVKHCAVHRGPGCAHVDGMWCNMDTCSILTAHGDTQAQIVILSNCIDEMEEQERLHEALMNVNPGNNDNDRRLFGIYFRTRVELERAKQRLEDKA